MRLDAASGRWLVTELRWWFPRTTRARHLVATNGEDGEPDAAGPRRWDT
jgi:hypothetical protein